MKTDSHIILIVAAHTDDETLGLGGTIAKHVSNGDKVFALSMTDGVSSRSKVTNKEINSRIQASLLSSKILGFEWLENNNFPDNQLDTIPFLEIVKFIEYWKNKIKPKIIYTHSYSDLNIDHQIVSRATLTAFRPKAEEIWEEIRSFEIPSSTDYSHNHLSGKFNPNLYINIKDQWSKKLEALNCYRDELMTYPNSRSLNKIKNLAEFRGGESGLELAEAFEIIRKIVRN